MKTKITILLGLILVPFFVFPQWTIQSTGFADSLRSLENIWVVDENTVWAAAKDGSGNDSIIQEFTRTVDGGTTWTPSTINNAAGLSASMIFGLDSSTAWIAMYDPNNDGGKILKTTDGGQNWTHQSTAIFNSTLGAYPNTIYFWNANEGFCMGDPTNDYFEIYTTSNGGSLWTRVDSINIPTIISGEYGYAAYLSVVGNTVWFGTSKGRIFKSNNKGQTWTLVTTPFTSSGKIRFLQFRDTLNGIIGNRVNNSFTMYSTINGGSTWQAISPTGTVYGNNVVLVEGTANTLISTGNASALSGSSISHDYGVNWTNIPGSTGMAFTALSNFKNQTGWAGLKNQSSTVGGIAKLQLKSADAGIISLIEPINPCEGVHDVKCLLKNFGDGMLDSVQIKWRVSFGVDIILNHQTHLASGQSEIINLGPYNFIAGVPYQFYVQTMLPNGLQDQNLLNDSILITITANPNPVVNLGSDTVFAHYTPYILDAGSIYFSYLWSTGDTTQTITVDTNLIGINNSTLISVTVENNFGCFGSDTIIIEYLYDGIDEINDNQLFTVYPNPTDGKFYLNTTYNSTNSLIQIYDVNGKIIFSEVENNLKNHEIELSENSKGIYFVKIISDEFVITKRLILK